MNYYLINDSKDWADECDVQFYEILNEEEYQKYMYCKEKFKTFEGSLYFGTNEGWDDDFDFLDFNPVLISNSDADTLKRHWPSSCQAVYDYLMETLDDMSIDRIGYCISNLSLDGFKQGIDKLIQ